MSSAEAAAPTTATANTGHSRREGCSRRPRWSKTSATGGHTM